MRLSLRRIVAQRPHIQIGNCIRCQKIYHPISNVHRPTSVFQYRRYADNVKNPESKAESPRVESTGRVSDDTDTMTTESPGIQKPPPSSTSQPEKSNPRQKQSSPSRGRKSSQKWNPKYSKKTAQSSKSKYPKTTTQKWKQKKYARKAAQKSKQKSKKPSLLKVIAETSLRRRIIWNPPLKEINPAYDMALDILEQDRAQKIKVVTRLENRLTRELERTHPTHVNQPNH
jgi:DNA mismatch repair ATPase MutL